MSKHRALSGLYRLFGCLFFALCILWISVGEYLHGLATLIVGTICFALSEVTWDRMKREEAA